MGNVLYNMKYVDWDKVYYYVVYKIEKKEISQPPYLFICMGN